MNRQKIQLIITAALLAVAGLVYLAVLKWPKKAAETAPEKEKIMVFDADSLESLTFTGTEEELSFSKKDGVWILKGYEDRTVDESKLKYAINCCINLPVEQKFENADKSEFGFDEPARVVRFTADGAEHTVTYGLYNAAGYVHYIMVDDDPAVYVYSHSESTAFDNDAEYFLKPLPEENKETE